MRAQGEGTQGGTAEGNDDPNAEARALAYDWLGRWSSQDRGTDLNPAANDHSRIAAMVDVLSTEPPITKNGAAVAQHVLIPQAVEHLMAKRSPFKGIQYALKCVQSTLGEWKVKGVPGDGQRPAAGQPAPRPVRPPLTSTVMNPF